jgi:hypothetical protein
MARKTKMGSLRNPPQPMTRESKASTMADNATASAQNSRHQSGCYGFLVPIVLLWVMQCGIPAWHHYRAHPREAKVARPHLDRAGAPPATLLNWLTEREAFCSHGSQPRCHISDEQLIQSVGLKLPALLAAEILSPSGGSSTPCDTIHYPNRYLRRLCELSKNKPVYRQIIAAQLLVTLDKPGHEAVAAILQVGNGTAVEAVTWAVLNARNMPGQQRVTPLAQLLLMSKDPLVLSQAFLRLEDDSIRIPDPVAIKAVVRAVAAEPPRVPPESFEHDLAAPVHPGYRVFLERITTSRAITSDARRAVLQALVDTFPQLKKVEDARIMEDPHALYDMVLVEVSKVIVDLAEQLALEKDSGALPAIRRAHRLFTRRDVGSYIGSARLRSLILARKRLEELRPRWYPVTEMIKWAERHPTTWPLGIPTGLLLVWITMLYIWPIGLFYVAQRVRESSGSPIKLGIVTISPVAFTLLPLFDRQHRVLDAGFGNTGRTI